jgi:BlaI family transcriptional regulator, penicillinase repressor
MKQLTKAEEQVMQILWDLQKGYINDILDQIPNPKPAYNTVSTIVRILEKKGFVGYKAYGKTHEYYPLIERNNYRSFYLKAMIANYFGGSFERLVSFFAKDNDMNIQEMEELLKNVQSEIKDPPNE